MNRKGFIFDLDRCVDCKACIAACLLENQWSFIPREIYRSESCTGNAMSIINLSMACNHCDTPSCSNMCPAGAYYRDDLTGALILDDSKCLGCNYCQWNCPFDAPKINPSSGLIGKCNLCFGLLKEELIPACSSACPTGALSFDTIGTADQSALPEWIPGKTIGPKLNLTSTGSDKSLRIVPDGILENHGDSFATEEKSVSSEWSLIGFTFLITLSVGSMLSSLLTAALPDPRVLISLIALSGAVSIFHLRKKFRAWRAVTNIRHSPLSREIAVWIVYSVLTTAAVLLQNTILAIPATLTGLLLLLVIDSVYTSSDRRISFILNSGQTFFTGLLITSYLADMREAFVFLSVIKLISGIFCLARENIRYSMAGLRILRLVLLVTATIFMVRGITETDKAIFYMFMAGELIDRILYYKEFKPVSITSGFKSNNKVL